MLPHSEDAARIQHKTISGYLPRVSRAEPWSSEHLIYAVDIGRGFDESDASATGSMPTLSRP